MENKNYFIPAIEDIRIGYECEIQRKISGGIMAEIYGVVEFSKYWETVVVGKQPEYSTEFTIETFKKAITDLYYPHPSIDQCKEYLQHSRLRTPYLSREQIKLEGWNDITLPVSEGLHFEKPGTRLMYDPSTKKLMIAVGISIYYYGQCKCINEYRTICKLLGI